MRRIARRLGPAYRGGNEEEHMTDRIDVARELYEAVAAGDREAIAGRLAADVRWQGRERGRRGHRRRSRCAGADAATDSMLLIGRKLPTVRPRAFHVAGDRVLVGLWAETMERCPARWWTILTIRDERVVAVEDHNRHRDAVRALERDASVAR
jgi:ketosteroid isomerase-like protein